MQYIDPAVRAQDDFFMHLNGKWLKTTEIPADKSSWGTLRQAARRHPAAAAARSSKRRRRTRPQKAGTEARKIGDLYASFMDEQRLEQLGYKPLAGELQRIRALKDKKAMPALIAHLSQIGVPAPYGIYVGQDARESTRYAAYISQSGLGMPDRDYYLKKDDAKLADDARQVRAARREDAGAWPATRTPPPPPRRSSRCETAAGRSAVDQGRQPRPGQALQQDRRSPSWPS